MNFVILSILLIIILLNQLSLYLIFYKRKNKYKLPPLQVEYILNLSINLVVLITLVIKYNEYGLISLSVATLIFSLLNYLTIEDLFHKEISFYIVIFINIILFLTRFISLIPFYSNYSNSNFIIAGFFCASLTYILFKITKRHGIGEGDIYLAFFVGILFGLSKYLVLFFYIMLISASLIGLAYSLKKKQFRNLTIPLIPFITFSIYITIFFSEQILNLIEKIFMYFLL